MIKNVYKEANFKKTLQDLARESNDIFNSLKRKGKIKEKELKYFTINHKKVSNLGKMYLWPKMQKKLNSVFVRPVISNCHTPTVKVSELLDNELNLSSKKVCLTLKMLITLCLE